MLVQAAGVLEAQVTARAGVLRTLGTPMFADVSRQTLLPLIFLTTHVATQYFVRSRRVAWGCVCCVLVDSDSARWSAVQEECWHSRSPRLLRIDSYQSGYVGQIYFLCLPRAL